MPTLTPIIEAINKSRGTDTRKFLLPSVNAGSGVKSSEYLLPMTANGILIQLKIMTKSTNFAFYLYNRAGIDPTVADAEVLYKQTNINKVFGFMGTGADSISPNEYNIYYANKDVPPVGALYFMLVNNDAGNASGAGFLWLTAMQD